MTSMPCYGVVYGLHDPETGELRYIGQTTKRLEVRLRQHLSSQSLAKPTHACRWLHKLMAAGATPTIHLRATAEGREDLDRLEIQHIAAARAAGVNLTNTSDGGGGVSGHRRKPMSPETKAKISASRKGIPSPMKGRQHSSVTKQKMQATYQAHPLSVESRAKIGAARRGVATSPETKAKLAAANTGKRPSAQTRQKLSEALKGRTLSPEHRANLSVAQTGKAPPRGRRKLSPSQVEEVVHKGRSGAHTAAALGLEYHVSYQTICRVLSRAGVTLKAGRPYANPRVLNGQVCTRSRAAELRSAAIGQGVPDPLAPEGAGDLRHPAQAAGE